MKKIYKSMKRIFAIILALTLLSGAIPEAGIKGVGALVAKASGNNDITQTDDIPTEEFAVDNGYIKVTVSDKNGGFGIRTLIGDKVNKDDNNKLLLFQYDADNTSFTSFQVEREGVTKEYIFGGKYDGSSEVTVSKENDELVAQWSVDQLTFTQKISLVNSGANEHGTAYISYSVTNAGEPANVKCRMLLDTALGYQDYAYYNTGDANNLVDSEVTLGKEGYSKAFYAVDNVGNPSMTAYTINASVNDEECKPYQTTFAHWNNLAATVFDYTPDGELTFTNPYNKKYLTADSAFALYFDMGQVVSESESVIGTNYGIFSNETVEAETRAAVNLIAPDELQFTVDASGKEDQSAYADGGKFTIKTSIENISDKTFEKVRVLVYTTSGIDPLNQLGESTDATYENPYYVDFVDFVPGENKMLEWDFTAVPQETGQYGKVHYKVYNISDDATLNTGAIMTENLMGEGYSYILCPGSVEKIPAIKFTGSSPEILYNEGLRNFYITGDNFSMLADAGAYQVLLSRVDGNLINGQVSVVIPEEYIQIDTTKNVLTVMMTDEVPGSIEEGMYQLTIDYTDSSKEDLTAPALRFQVKADAKYRNDAYGFLAVVKKDTGTLEYEVQQYLSETEYQEALSVPGFAERVLLELKGTFVREEKDGSVIYTGVSLSDTDNVMTLNDCLDIKDGTLTVTDDGDSILVDFDADIYTTGAGTSVWSGVAALTAIEDGTEYGLIPYDEDGNREDFNKEPITLLWPSVGQGFQNLMGLLFDFKYGELGVIRHEDESAKDTKVVAFGASMDLSFIIPDGSAFRSTKQDPVGPTWSELLGNGTQVGPMDIRAVHVNVPCRSATVNTNATQETVKTELASNNSQEIGTSMGDDASGGDGDTRSASIQIDDVLFGGEYLGVNMSVALGIPGYIEGMPGMEAILSVKTVGDWAVGASGVCSFANFYLEGSIQILSEDGIPIPDSLTFFMGGVVPGVNVDGFGVLWLQGAGGGIENLYDTIFLEDAVPPLKLILEAEFAVLQVISARATLGLSLQGIDVSLTNGKLANAIPVLNYAGVNLQWYPEFYLMGSVQVSIMDAITGGGYIVVENNGFFEFFLHANLQIPSSIPIVGGISVAGVGVGANADKVWGQVNVLDIPVGITYYWGGNIDWESGSEVMPTYPELAGMNAASAVMPVVYNEATGQTLYARVGMNLRMRASTLSQTNLLNTEISDELYTDISGKKSNMTLYNNGCSKLLVIEWTVDENVSDAEAQAARDAFAIQIVDNNNEKYEIKYLDNNKSLDDSENQNANANLTYDPETRTATAAISFTNESVYERVWNINTDMAASLVLYDVEPLPQLPVPEKVTADNESNTLTVEWPSGQDLSALDAGVFDHISFIIEGEEMQEAVMAYRISADTDTGTIGLSQPISFSVPESLSSGTYKLLMIGQDDNAQYYSEVEAEFIYENKNQPATPMIAGVKGAGDYKVEVTLEVPDQTGLADFDGYVLSAYDSAGNPVNGVSDLFYYKDGSSIAYNEDGTIAGNTSDTYAESIVFGGHYEYPYTETNEETGEEETKTLIAGFSEGEYTVQVRRWKSVDGGKALLYSKADEESVNVTKPVETVITVEAQLPEGGKSMVKTMTLGNEDTYEQTVYNVSDLELILSGDSQVSGRWELDGGTKEGTSGAIVLSTKAKISLAGLEDGVHTLEFKGKNEYGDASAVKYVFAVDTQAPRLLLETPVNGSLFDYLTGKLTVTGVTDQDAVLAITDNGEPVAVSGLSIDDTGRFTTDVVLDTSVLNHELMISVQDALGNTTEKVVDVVSDALGSIEKLLIYAGSSDVTNTKLSAGTKYVLKLMAQMKNESAQSDAEPLLIEVNNASLVEWEQAVAEGTSEILQSEASAKLTTSEDAEGMITARFIISDAGTYSVSAAFGYTGDQQISLDSEHTYIKVADQLFTDSAVTPDVEVWYKGTKLEEGTDYEVSYANNIEVSTNSDTKPQVIITGINGTYTGSSSEIFEISYLPMETPYYTISGTVGDNGYYKSDVEILSQNGYKIMTDLQGVAADSITLTEEKENQTVFWLRRDQDGALTDKVTVSVKIDKTMPTGMIALDEKKWDKFLSAITFGIYKTEDLAVEITAADNYSGVAKVEYVILDKVYGSAAELEAAAPVWNVYADSNKPEILKDTDQVVYARITDNAGNVSYLCSEGFHVDTISPTAQIKVSENKWTEFLNNITFGLFFKETQTVEIIAADSGSGIADIYYYVTEEGITEEEVKALSAENWTKYTRTFGIDPDAKCVIYVKAEDRAGNVTYISSDGMVIKNSTPVISGVEDGQNYYGDTTFTMADEYLDVVKVDGVEVSLSEGSYTILADNESHTIVATDKAGNSVTYEISVYEIYDVTFVADGTMVDTIQVNHGDNLTAEQFPAIPGKTGYDQTAPVWNPAALENVTADTTVEAVYTANVYTVTLPEDPEGYTIVPEQETTVEHGQAFSFTVSVEEGYEAGTDFKVYADGTELEAVDGKYTIAAVGGAVEITVEGVVDVAAPTAQIKVSENKWTEFLNNITFGLFFKETQTVEIIAADSGSGIADIYYYVTEEGITEEEVKALSAENWTKYTRTFGIDPDAKCVIYVKAEDRAGNVTYISSDGMVIKNSTPVISGVEDGQNYYGDTTFTMADEYLDVVKVDGVEVSLSEGSYTILADNESHTIVATDKAGNSVTYEISVYEIYDVTFVADGTMVDTIQVNHGDNLTAEQFPAIPGKTGYDQTAPVWNPAALENVTADTAVEAVYTPNVYTVTIPADREGYIIVSEQGNQVKYGEAFVFSVNVEEGYAAGTDFKVYADGTELEAVDGKYTIAAVGGDVEITVEGVEKKAQETLKPSVDIGSGQEHQEEITNTDENAKPVTESLPNTSDTSMIEAYILLLLFAALAMLGVLFKKRRVN